MQGTGDTLTLYTADGQPVTVRLVDGEYRLVTDDAGTQRQLDRIIVLLNALVARGS